MVLKNQREFLQKSFKDNYLKRTGFFFYSLESLPSIIGFISEERNCFAFHFGLGLYNLLLNVKYRSKYVYLKVFFEPVIGFYRIIFRYRQTFFSLKIDETLGLKESLNYQISRFKIKFHSIISKDVQPRNYLIVWSKTAEKKK